MEFKEACESREKSKSSEHRLDSGHSDDLQNLRGRGQLLLRVAQLALADVGDPSVIPYFIALLEDPDPMVREMAGAIVRLMDMAQYFELPIGKAILAEIEANRQRGFRHGGKAA